MEEIWKDIAGFEGHYQVSNMGRVRSLRHRWGNRECPRILVGHDNARGYLQVALLDGKGGRVIRRVHRLVAGAFIPNPSNLPCINHKDENRVNNRADNLEWCTIAYNNNYGDHGLHQSAALGRSIAQYDLNGRLIAIYRSSRHAANSVPGCTYSGILGCCNRNHQQWYKGFMWKWA